MIFTIENSNFYYYGMIEEKRVDIITDFRMKERILNCWNQKEGYTSGGFGSFSPLRVVKFCAPKIVYFLPKKKVFHFPLKKKVFFLLKKKLQRIVIIIIVASKKKLHVESPQTHILKNKIRWV